MWKIVFSVILGAIYLSSCGYHDSKQPEWPSASKAPGWRTMYENGVKVIGRFALKKGQSTENGTIGISLVDVIPGSLLADRGSYNGSAKAVLKFYRVSDKGVLCEVTLTTGSRVLQNSDYCAENPGFSVINIEAINTRQQWAWFTLIE